MGGLGGIAGLVGVAGDPGIPGIGACGIHVMFYIDLIFNFMKLVPEVGSSVYNKVISYGSGGGVESIIFLVSLK